MYDPKNNKRLATPNGTWEFQGLYEDPDRPLFGELKAIFEHIVRMDGTPVPSVRLQNPHVLAYTRQEVGDHLKRPGLSPISSRLLQRALEVFDHPLSDTILQIEDEPPELKPPAASPFRRLDR